MTHFEIKTFPQTRNLIRDGTDPESLLSSRGEVDSGTGGAAAH